jgi:hypothetical protein
MYVQALIPQAAIKRLDKRIIRGFSWSRQVQHHTLFIGPLILRQRNKFTAVVNLNPLGRTA